MSAVATKKRNGDRGVQLTFPSNFQKAYDLGFAYFPSSEGGGDDIMIGRDFQSEYHAEKKREADRSVLNGIQAKQTAQLLMMTGHQNYHLPKPVLAQRKFANPANGVVGFPSARRDDKNAPFITIERGMVGGVLSSAEGQQYYRNKLEERSEQLSRINTLALGQPVPYDSQSRLMDTRKIGSKDKVEFFLALNLLTNVLIDGDISRFSFDDLKVLLNYLFRIGGTLALDELEAILKGLDTVLYTLEDALSENPITTVGFYRRPANGQDDTTADNRLRNFGETLLAYLQKARSFTVEMIRTVNFTPAERAKVVETTIRTLGFDRILAFPNATVANQDEARRNPRAAQRREDFDGEDGGDGDDDGGGDGEFFGAHLRRRTGQRRVTREDEENQQQRQPFAGVGFDENQSNFGRRNGQLVYGETAYFDGGAPRMVAPLTEAGFDPKAEGQQLDPTSLVEVAETIMNGLAEELGWNGLGKVKDFLMEEYPDAEENLSQEIIQRFEGQGYTPAQVARGLEGTDLAMLFGEYIRANSGPIDVARAVPAYDFYAHNFGMGGLVGVTSGPPTSSPLPTYRSGRGPFQFESLAPLNVAPLADDDAPVSFGGKDYPSRNIVVQVLTQMGMPLTRSEFNERFRTTASIIPIAARLPAEYGGPYNIRSNTHPKNARETLVKKIVTYLDPRY